MTDIEKITMQKQDALNAAFNHVEGPYVPSAIGASVPTVAWVGKTAVELIYKPEEFVTALTDIFKDMWCDGNILLGTLFTPRREETFKVVQNKFGPDGITPEHIQMPFMKEDEYDQLAKDPDRFIANVLLPRKYPWLFTDRERAKAALKVYAEDNFYCMANLLASTNKVLEEQYGIKSISDMSKRFAVPVDNLFDEFRGFQGTIIDLRRRPKEVHAALDTMWELSCKPMMREVTPRPFACQMPHIAPYLNAKQFDEFYWPHQKAFIMHYANGGSKSWIMFEGRWERVWDHFMDVPKDSVIAHIDDDDFVKAKKTIGQHQIIEGGARVADLRCSAFASIKDKIAATIDECAAGGGFIFCPDKSLITPGDINQNTVDCYNFVHEYTQK